MGIVCPAAPIRDLHDLTRAVAVAVGDRTREALRLEKMLERSGIKLSGSVSSITGISSRAMLDALIRGERDPLVLAQYAKRRMRSKISELVEALTGRFSDHHAFLAQLYLAEIDAVFSDADHLASWAGVCPSAHESSGRIKSSRTLPGNTYLKAALSIAASAASHHRSSYLAVKYRRIAARRGQVKVSSLWNAPS